MSVTDVTIHEDAPAEVAAPVKPPLLTEAQLQKIMPKVGERAGLYLPHLVAGMEQFDIRQPKEIAAFLAQLAVESKDLTVFSEDLNYTAARLAAVWPSRYSLGGKKPLPNDLAKRLAGKPEAIANNVYANRNGNGDEASGDGFAFRGAGAIQITFRMNHARVAKFFRLDLAKVGEWLRSPEGAMLSACWYWWAAGCSKPALTGDFDQVCDLINIGRHTAEQGDALGYADRKAAFLEASKVLA
jgi:putative chitinase